MPILISTFVLAMGAGWQPVGGQLLGSGVLLLCGYQDVGLRARFGATFWFFMALAFCVSALATALRAKLWGDAAMSVAVLCLEAWLILRWQRRRTSG
jgi:hypothetical protein